MSTYGPLRAWKLLGDLGREIFDDRGGLGQLARSLKAHRSSSRVVPRELFPLPFVCLGAATSSSIPKAGHDDASDFISAVVVVLNYLYGIKCGTTLPARANCIQRAAQEHIVDRAVHFASRLASATWEHQDDTRILSSMERSGERERLDLVADLVDNLDEAAQFDPMPFLPSPIRKLLSDPSKLFTFVGRGPGAKSRFTAGRRDEYIKLVVARLRNGQLGLVSEPLAGGTVFPVSKAGGRLREVWHGKALTQQTVRPPKPPGLAGPSAFRCLEASAEHPLRMSKRDGK
jgi:hypothetical protein